ncbi:hypothetical protein EON79_08700 [bacterium]|nr:MAG: hypothetical protein EON79_08700 [bacterium]
MLLAIFSALYPRGPVVHAGVGYMFRMTPPSGWFQVAPAPGIVAQYAQNEARLTLTVLPKGKRKAEAVIDEALTEAKKAIPDSLAAAAGSFRTEYEGTGFLFAVGPKESEGKRFLFAFYDTPIHVVTVGLSAPNREAQTLALDKFASYVRSFGFVTEKVVPKLKTSG